MSGPAGARLDWSMPWFAPWREPGERIAGLHAQGVPVHEALAREVGPLRFVAQDALPPGEAYETFILRTGCCPTRDNLHDFFNGLAWLKFPQAKRQLNQLQAAEIESGRRHARGPVRDAITVFDENGALLHAPPQLWVALGERDWQRLFVGLRPLWAQARLLLFGHALLEKMAAPRKEVTAHVWRANAPSGAAFDDDWLAGQFTPARLGAKNFTPLPLSGVPGWWPGNEEVSFYDDRRVFRPPRSRGLDSARPVPMCSASRPPPAHGENEPT